MGGCAGGTRLVAPLVVLVLSLATAGTAGAASYTLNFDATPAGTVVSTGPGGLELQGAPRVFTAGSNASSPPNALRRPADCPNDIGTGECTTGDHQLVLVFANPARTISLKAGNPLFPGCFEFSCPAARMAAFDAANNLVGITPWTDLMNDGSMSFSLSLSLASHVIRRVVYSVSEDPETGAGYFDSREFTAQVDDIAYDVLEPDEPPPPPPPPVAAPTVDITEPAAGASFATTGVTVAGTYTAAAGLADTCVAANTSADLPSGCAAAAGSRTDGTFSAGRIPGMRPGANTIRVWVRDTRGRIATDAVTVTVADGDFDFRIETLEITQGIQVAPLPTADEFLSAPIGTSIGPLSGVAGDTYDGVPLASNKRTIVRMYGAARGAASPVAGTPALLHAFRRRGDALVELASSPLVPIGTPDPLVADPAVPALRAAAGGSFNFILPSEWTREGEELILVGEIAPGSATSATADCCRTNNFFGLQGIRFEALRAVTVFPLNLTWTDAAGTLQVPPADARPLFEGFQTVLPAPTTIAARLPSVDVTDIVAPEVARPPGERDDFRALYAINDRLYEAYRDSGLRGKIAGHVVGLGGGAGPGPTSVNGAFNSQLDFVAHEVGHSIGLAHAHSGNGCSDDDGNGVFDGPRSMRGTLNGVGLDPRLWSGGSLGRFKPIGEEDEDVFDATPNAPADVYDYMSYCSNETIGASWVSSGYWANQVREFRSGGSLVVDFNPGCCFLGAAADPTVRGLTAAGPLVHVSAIVRAAGADITKVQTGSGTPTPPAAGSSVEIVVRDGAGAEVSRTAVPTIPIAARPGPGQPEPAPALLVSADVPGAGARSVDVVVAGVVRATRGASPAAPVVKLQRPAGGVRIRGNRSLTIRWTATDADGDALTADVGFSTDGGRTWLPLGSALTGGRLSVRGRDLPRTARGQLRVVVGDGFHATTDVARRLRTDGALPTVTILSPAKGTPLREDAVVVLEGQAVDDAGRRITGKRLIWQVGGLPIGRGAVVDATGYEIATKVSLIAIDRFGRPGVARLKLAVRRVAPILTTLIPGKLAAAARTLTLRVAASVPAKLTVSGAGIRRRSTRVGLADKTVRVKLTGTARPSYAAKLTIGSGKLKTSQQVTVARG